MSKKKVNRLVVAPGGWHDTIPEWLLEEVKSERLIYGLASLMKPSNKVGDAEACLYLYTVSFVAPLSYLQTEVYVYLVAKLMKKRQPKKTLPDFAKEKLKKGLTKAEELELDDLKRELFEKRGGEIIHPLLDALRELKKRSQKKEGEKEL